MNDKKPILFDLMVLGPLNRKQFRIQENMFKFLHSLGLKPQDYGEIEG